jgi:hypothetical protein
MLYNNLLKLVNIYKFKKIHKVEKCSQKNLFAKYICEETSNTIKTHKYVACNYCNNTGWITWKSNNNIMLLDLNKQPTIVLYSICSKCQ